jgi:hypothetical protein
MTDRMPVMESIVPDKKGSSEKTRGEDLSELTLLNFGFF